MGLIEKLGEGISSKRTKRSFIKRNMDLIALIFIISMIVIGLGQAVYKSIHGTDKERYERFTGFKLDEKKDKNEYSY